jgi:hypothetical protein
MLPPGLRYVDSWIDAQNLDRCFQLMETDDATRFEAESFGSYGVGTLTLTNSKRVAA